MTSIHVFCYHTYPNALAACHATHCFFVVLLLQEVVSRYKNLPGLKTLRDSLQAHGYVHEWMGIRVVVGEESIKSFMRYEPNPFWSL